MKTKIGYFSIADAWTPAECLQQSIAAEKIGFDTLWVEDHLVAMPGGTECNFAWTVMSSALQATKKIPFYTGVTAPIMRYNPAIVAQAFATMGAMYPGRVGLGVGTGEPPNEMAVYGGEWPSNITRLEMLEEALTVINRLWESDVPINFAGKYYTLNNAILLTKPEKKIPVYVSAIGPRAADLAGRLGDHIITFANNPSYVRDELIPALEAGAKSAGKDSKNMERVVYFSFVYDPNQEIRPEDLQQDAGVIHGGAVSRALTSGVISIFNTAEDFIRKIEEYKRMGYNHLALADATPPVQGKTNLDIWKDVLPHVR